MRKARIVTLLKLVVVAALMAYVFSTIQWRDTLTRSDAAGSTISSTEGRIIGPWDAAQVEFRPAGAAKSVTVEPGTGPGGTRVAVTPGLTTYVRNLDPALFLLGALCSFLSFTYSALRWWWLMRVAKLQVSILEAQRFTWIGIFFNNLVPGQTGGDVVKALYVMRHCPGGRVPALVSVVVDRVLGLAALAILGAVVVLFFLERFRVLALGIWTVIIVLAIAGALVFSRRLRRRIRLDALVRALPQKVAHLLQQVDQAVFLYRSHKRGIVLWLLASIGNHVISVLSVVFIGHALGVGLPSAEYFVLVPVINIVSSVPIAPNGWGVGEALYGKLFGDYGAVYLDGVADPERVMRTRGVALSILFRIHLTLWSLLGGILMLFERERVTRADVQKEVERERLEESG